MKIGLSLSRCCGVFACLCAWYSVAGAQCRFVPGHGSRAVTYRFQQEAGKAGAVLHVTLEFEMSAAGSDTLMLPTGYAGERLRSLSFLHPVSSGTEILYGAEPHLAIVRDHAHRHVVIGYDLTKDWNGPLVHPFQFHPVILRPYVEFNGSNALVRPMLEPGAQETANFDWMQVPAAWTIATSFGAGAAAGDRCQTVTTPWEEISKALFAAGDFRLHNFQIRGKPAVLAIRGAWTFSDEKAVEQIARVVGSVREFWHDDNFPYFLVTLKPYDQDHGSWDGSAFTNAFWMYVARKDSLDGLLPVLAHESFHAWNPFRMGAYPRSSDNQDYEDTKWFKEGFTEYYAQLLTYEASGQSAESYVRSLNKDLRLFPASTSEYVRGRIIALWLDGTIRAQSQGKHSLDDVMRGMVATADRPYTQNRVFAVMGTYISADAQGLLERAVEDHGTLPAPERLPRLEGCARATLDDVQPYELGLDFDSSHTERVLSGVVADGPAYAAGLRNGQSLASWSVTTGDADHEESFTIVEGTERRTIRYFPRGKATKIWQYHLDPAKACGSVPAETFAAPKAL